MRRISRNTLGGDSVSCSLHETYMSRLSTRFCIFHSWKSALHKAGNSILINAAISVVLVRRIHSRTTVKQFLGAPQTRLDADQRIRSLGSYKTLFD